MPSRRFVHGATPTNLPVTIVVITRNRRAGALATIAKLTSLPARPPVIVVDNASRDGTADAIEQAFPRVELIRSERNLGAAGRNVGVRLARTPYVAFADDDSWWASGSLGEAAKLFDAFPRLAVVAARVLVGPDETVDPTCRLMADSGLAPAADLPGVPIYGFVACGAVVHRNRFLAAGGFPERFGIGGEEAALSLALARDGWGLSYVEDIIALHDPSVIRDRAARRAAVTRNDLWVAWQYRRAGAAMSITRRALVRAVRDNDVRRGVIAAARTLPTVIRCRKPVPPDVEIALSVLDRRSPRSLRR
jgi:GT2 family glycosyltransferase